jgi:hypothetical protein
MKEKIAIKLRTQMKGNFNNAGSADENKQRKKSLQQFLPLTEDEIQGLLHPVQTNLARFQSLQLPSTQSESPLAPKCHVSFSVGIQL